MFISVIATGSLRFLYILQKAYFYSHSGHDRSLQLLDFTVMMSRPLVILTSWNLRHVSVWMA
ncbi:hypothetical protein E2C01_090315 [Portunus trituberculatus]|uniref:Uncharacterized protein n=1 Tax=Portunus trituberculatus TaxID=210409 RepID=A0A5B7JJY0_PORTR|nr:hypothetical protein [Portunus trituberculatus]